MNAFPAPTGDVVVLVAGDQVGDDFYRAVAALAHGHAVLVVFAHPVDAAVLDRVRDAGAALAVVAPTSHDLFGYIEQARDANRHLARTTHASEDNATRHRGRQPRHHHRVG